MTIQLAYAAGKDAGDRNMRKAGRKVWSKADYNAAAKELDRIWPLIENPPRKKNPDLLSMFANAAVGVASTLQIHEMVKSRKRKAAPKKRGTTKAKARKSVVSGRSSVVRKKRRNPSQPNLFKRQPKGELYVLTIGSGDDLISVYLHDGDKDGFSKRFKTMAGAKAYATRNKVKLVQNPKRNGIIKRAWARSQAASEYRRELRLEAAAERSRARRRKAEAKAKANPTAKRKTTPKQKPIKRPILKPAARKPKKAAARKNPTVKVPRRRTFEMFQGRKATTAKPMAVSRHAPAKLDALGSLVELKINGGPKLTFPNGVKLCAARGRLWIAGKRFARPNPGSAANVLNPIGEIDYVVYATRKPHHGDHGLTHYIHHLGEVSGRRPVLAVDREGYPVIKGGNYTIKQEGIVD